MSSKFDKDRLNSQISQDAELIKQINKEKSEAESRIEKLNVAFEDKLREQEYQLQDLRFTRDSLTRNLQNINLYIESVKNGQTNNQQQPYLQDSQQHLQGQLTNVQNEIQQLTKLLKKRNEEVENWREKYENINSNKSNDYFNSYIEENAKLRNNIDSHLKDKEGLNH